MNLNCVLIDDKHLCLKTLERYCKKTDAIDLKAIYSSGQAAIDHYVPSEIDLVFLDVKMLGTNSMEFLDQLPTVPNIIFTTSDPQHPIAAFKYNAIGYLIKPIPYPQFKQVVEKAWWSIFSAFSHYSPVYNKQLFIKEKGHLIRLNVDDILYFENIRDYVMIVTTTSKHIIYSTLKSVLEKVPAEYFQKVHRTYIVNFNKIDNIENNSLVIGRKLIPISKSQKPLLMSRIKLL
ncbi:MAG: two-component system response regulator LytT [Paraglaciecola sp.]|jgi:two-component system response regulator LytT